MNTVSLASINSCLALSKVTSLGAVLILSMICSLNSFSLIPKLLAISSGYCKFASFLNICIYLFLPNPSIHSVLVVSGILIFSLPKANLNISSSSYSIIDCISLYFCLIKVSSTSLVSVNRFPNLPKKYSLFLTVVSKLSLSINTALISSGVGSGSIFSGSSIGTFSTFISGSSTFSNFFSASATSFILAINSSLDGGFSIAFNSSLVGSISSFGIISAAFNLSNASNSSGVISSPAFGIFVIPWGISSTNSEATLAAIAGEAMLNC
ncbi:hypothetical protein ES705_28260 [subsurface metagenome]